MNREIKEEVNDYIRDGYKGLLSKVGKPPIVWEGSSVTGYYQAELQATWDDKVKKTIRVSCFIDYEKKKWWHLSKSLTVYDEIFTPNDGGT